MSITPNPESGLAAPTWELLPQPSDEHLLPVEPSSELEIAAHQAGTVAVSGDIESLQMKPGSNLAIPTAWSWWATGKVAAANDVTHTIISTDPALIGFIKKNEAKERKYESRSLPPTPVIVGYFALSGVTALSGIVGGALAAGGSEAMLIVAAAGGVAGFFAPMLPAGAAVFLKNRIDDFAYSRRSKAIAAIAARSEQLYVIPNEGTFTKDLGREVAKTLRDAEEPHELLMSKIAPIVQSIMKAEVELAEIEPELQVIEARTKALPAAIPEDQISQEELLAKKSRLAEMADRQKKEISEIGQNEVKDRNFRKAVAEVFSGSEDLPPYLREFQDGIVMAIKTAYTPRLSRIANDALHDVAKAIKTVDEERLCQPVYEVLREKWAKNGLALPDYEVLQDQIVKTREQR